MHAMKSIIQILAIGGCFVTMASAQIDAGGGTTQVGAMNNHSSIGGVFATGSALVGALTNHSGLIEVLYAAASTTDPDANANDIPDS